MNTTLPLALFIAALPTGLVLLLWVALLLTLLAWAPAPYNSWGVGVAVLLVILYLLIGGH